MSIASMPELLARASRDGYAIGYYESWDQYSLEAVIEVAEETHSPAILGFGGAVSDVSWLDGPGIEGMAAMIRCMAERARIPAAVLFNEAQSIDQLSRGIHAGCNTAMLDTSHLPYRANLNQTRQVVAQARPLGAAVEAELGHLADGSDPSITAVGTDPDEAEQFVLQTGVDALAVSVGNVHVLSTGEAVIDLDMLERLHRVVPVPLVIHGGTGFPAAAIQAAIQRGVAKFNVGTRLKQAYLAGIQEAVHSLPTVVNVHDVIGSRKAADILISGKQRIKKEIRKLVYLYGSANRV